MKFKAWNTWIAKSSSTISVVVLAGFLSIQLHSFVHIDLFKIHPSQDAKSGQSLLWVNDGTSVQDSPEDCPECVLTKTLQLELAEQSSILPGNLFQQIEIIKSDRTSDSTILFSQLRAPPVYVA